jgi:hypothetical protein
MTTKVIDGVKLVEVPFTVTYNVLVEEHEYLMYVTNGISVEAMAQAGKETLLDVVKPRLDEANKDWTTMMIEVA